MRRKIERSKPTAREALEEMMKERREDRKLIEEAWFDIVDDTTPDEQKELVDMVFRTLFPEIVESQQMLLAEFGGRQEMLKLLDADNSVYNELIEMLERRKLGTGTIVLTSLCSALRNNDRSGQDRRGTLAALTLLNREGGFQALKDTVLATIQCISVCIEGEARAGRLSSAAIKKLFGHNEK